MKNCLRPFHSFKIMCMRMWTSFECSQYIMIYDKICTISNWLHDWAFFVVKMH